MCVCVCVCRRRAEVEERKQTNRLTDRHAGTQLVRHTDRGVEIERVEKVKQKEIESEDTFIRRVRGFCV